MDSEVSFQKCTMCGETLPLDAFYTDVRKASGRTSACIDCLTVSKVIKSRNRKTTEELKAELDQIRLREAIIIDVLLSRESYEETESEIIT